MLVSINVWRGVTEKDGDFLDPVVVALIRTFTCKMLVVDVQVLVRMW